MLRLIAIALILASPAISQSQQNYIAGTLTQANIDFNVAKNWKMNTKFESRQIFSEREPGEMKSNKLRYERTDLGFVLIRKLSADNSAGGGYLIRLEDQKFVHRFIQQFNHVTKFESARLGHRIIADETFRSDEATELRLRYRISLEKPFNGMRIDPKELYGKISNEYLGIFSDQSPDLEIRGSAAVGYNATDDNKIEIGFEYRTNEFNQPVNAQQFWLTIAWYRSI